MDRVADIVEQVTGINARRYFVEQEIIKILADELKTEIDNEILDKLRS